MEQKKEEQKKKEHRSDKPLATLYEVWRAKEVIEVNPEIKRTVWRSHEARRTEIVLRRLARQ